MLTQAVRANGKDFASRRHAFKITICDVEREARVRWQCGEASSPLCRTSGAVTRVLLDSDLAELYGVKTLRLNEQVRRNSDPFPDDFLLRLTNSEGICSLAVNVGNQCTARTQA